LTKLKQKQLQRIGNYKHGTYTIHLIEKVYLRYVQRRPVVVLSITNAENQIERTYYTRTELTVMSIAPPHKYDVVMCTWCAVFCQSD